MPRIKLAWSNGPIPEPLNTFVTCGVRNGADGSISATAPNMTTNAAPKVTG